MSEIVRIFSERLIFLLLIRISLQEGHSPHVEPTQEDVLSASNFADKISYAFQLATAQGPMCHEPIQGIAVFLEEVSVTAKIEDESPARETLGRLTGEVIKTVRGSIGQGFLDWSPRLLLAMYSCEIQASGTLILCLSSQDVPFSPLLFTLVLLSISCLD